MDIKFMEAEATLEEREAVDALLGAPESQWEGGSRDPRDAHVAFGGKLHRERRHLLLPALQALQSRVGWISEGGLDYVCRRLDVPPADAWGVATFYALFTTSPRPKKVLHVCDDIACRCKGAAELCDALEKSVGPAYAGHPEGDHVVVGDADAGWMRSPCLGLCDKAPAGFYSAAGLAPTETAIADLTVDKATQILSGGAKRSAQNAKQTGEAPPHAGPLLKRIGVVDPTSLDAYRRSGGYQALRKAFEMDAEAVIQEVTTSKLMGRGGAAFPTGRKWEAVARQPARPHYLICNADESEPGTFKDRELLDGDPFAIVEAMTIAAFATGCERGYLYIRGEFPLGSERIQHAIDETRSNDLLGENIMGRGFRFDIEVRRGSGAYICGEETAIFNSIEGYRGEPRNKPPFPVEAGLFHKPTLVNNVETLANVIPIVLDGGAAFAKIGTAQSTGTKLFCLSGSVQRPGVYEVPFGTGLGDLIEMAGGVGKGRKLQAVLLGGAAGVFVRPDELHMQLTFEGARTTHATLGSGVVMAFDDTVDMKQILLRIAAFFRDESCGQCVPCRVGTVRQEEALYRIVSGRARGGVTTEIALLDDVGVAMRDASICGLGQTAYSAVESAIKRLGIFAGQPS